MRARVHLLVSGRVQGVGFRYATKVEATRLGLAGWVRNLDDGRVEAVAEGERDTLETFVEWCRRGPPSSRVTDVAATWSDATAECPEDGALREADVQRRNRFAIER